MKKLLFLLLFSGALAACKKETCTDGILNQDEVEADCGGSCAPCAIHYPNTGTHGTNILNADSVSFSAGDYSMCAEIPEGSTLKIILYNVSGGGWFYGYGTAINMTIGPATSSQTFEAVSSGLTQVLINLPTGSGTCLIQFFENSSSETKTKTISWS